MSFKKTMSLNYHISFERFNEHLADIRIHHTALSDTPAFSMVTWIAGSYLIREFSKNITTVYYQIGDSPIRHRAEKIDKKHSYCQMPSKVMILPYTMKCTAEIYQCVQHSLMLRVFLEILPHYYYFQRQINRLKLISHCLYQRHFWQTI